jgi:hypothetical protein
MTAWVYVAKFEMTTSIPSLTSTDSTAMTFLHLLQSDAGGYDPSLEAPHRGLCSSLAEIGREVLRVYFL